MLLNIYKQFGQGISVGGCAVMSILTLSYMANDIHTMEKKQIKSTYEKQIKVLNEEIDKLKEERTETKIELL